MQKISNVDSSSLKSIQFSEVTKEGDTMGVVPSYGLLYITKAYNQKEISFDEWLKQSRAWAEKIIEQSKKRVV